MGYFGLPHIFMTINPNASHSPLFQLMYGDETVDLSERYPNLGNVLFVLLQILLLVLISFSSPLTAFSRTYLVGIIQKMLVLMMVGFLVISELSMGPQS